MANPTRKTCAEARLRVLQLGKFYAPLAGGMETHLKALCDGLKDRVDVEVIVANTERSRCTHYFDGVRVTRMPQWFKMAGASFCPSMIRQIRETEADIVHIHWPNPTALLAYLASGNKGRLVLTYHADTTRQRVLGPLFQPVLRYALRRSESVIVSSIMLARRSPVLARIARRCTAIPFGIDLRGYDDCAPAEVAAIRDQYAAPIILSIGRLVYYKGLEYLIRAMKGLPATLLIIGEGPLRPALEREAERVGASVHFLGRIENVVKYYRACEMFVLPSTERAEAFGLVQLEAMACGKPVINTWVPSGVPFVSLDGVTGVTVPPKNSTALADAIRLLLNDTDRRVKYGLAARRRVEEEFTVEKMVAQTLDTYFKGAATPADDPRKHRAYQ